MNERPPMPGWLIIGASLVIPAVRSPVARSAGGAVGARRARSGWAARCHPRSRGVGSTAVVRSGRVDRDPRGGLRPQRDFRCDRGRAARAAERRASSTGPGGRRPDGRWRGARGLADLCAGDLRAVPPAERQQCTDPPRRRPCHRQQAGVSPVVPATRRPPSRSAARIPETATSSGSSASAGTGLRSAPTGWC